MRSVKYDRTTSKNYFSIGAVCEIVRDTESLEAIAMGWSRKTSPISGDVDVCRHRQRLCRHLADADDACAGRGVQLFFLGCHLVVPVRNSVFATCIAEEQASSLA